MADFGYREGYATLGSYRSGDGLGWIYARHGDPDAPATGTVEAWIAANGPWTAVRMVTAYCPMAVRNFPVRGAVNGGEACAWPSIEAAAMVAAGIATPA